MHDPDLIDLAQYANTHFSEIYRSKIVTLQRSFGEASPLHGHSVECSVSSIRRELMIKIHKPNPEDSLGTRRNSTNGAKLAAHKRTTQNTAFIRH